MKIGEEVNINAHTDWIRDNVPGTLTMFKGTSKVEPTTTLEEYLSLLLYVKDIKDAKILIYKLIVTLRSDPVIISDMLMGRRRETYLKDVNHELTIIYLALSGRKLTEISATFGCMSWDNSIRLFLVEMYRYGKMFTSVGVDYDGIIIVQEDVFDTNDIGGQYVFAGTNDLLLYNERHSNLTDMIYLKLVLNGLLSDVPPLTAVHYIKQYINSNELTDDEIYRLDDKITKFRKMLI